MLMSRRRAIGCELICSRGTQRIDSVGDILGRLRIRRQGALWEHCGRGSRSSETFIMDSNTTPIIGYI